MSSDQNKATIRRFFELVNAGTVDTFDSVVAPQVLEHEQRFYTGLLTIFPDFKLTIEDILAEGDRVAIRFRVHATQHGEWRGIAPTGRQVSWTGMQWFRLQDGTIVDHAIAANQLDVLEQLISQAKDAASEDIPATD